MDRTRAPVVERLDPEARPAVIHDPVLVVIEIAVALQEAEATRTEVLEGGIDTARGVVERPPDALTHSGPQRQAIGIVDFRAPVDRLGFARLGEPIH